MTGIIITIRMLIKALTDLKNDGFITVVDQDDNEYVIENFEKRHKHGDNDREWNYAMKIRLTGAGCIKR